MKKTLLRAIALLLLIIALIVLVPSATPVAIGEEEVTEYPLYSPVTLEAENVQPIDWEADTPYLPHEGGYLPGDEGYLDPSLSVRIEYMRAYDTTIQLTWVQIADPTQLRAELCKPYPSKSTARADVLARRVNAVLAINGDYFMHRKEGFIARNGKVLRTNYNKLFDTLIIDDQGDFTILPSATKEDVESFEGTIIQALTFGPGLVIDGVKTTEFPLKISAPQKETQRIAIAQMDKLSYLIVATEGPENKGSDGLTMAEFAQLLFDLGAKNAYNLDGGSSSTVVLDNRKINSLSTHKIRAIGDILYFVTAVPDEGSAD